MNRAEKIAKLKESGITDDALIESIVGKDEGGANDARIAALEAKIKEAEGKAGGILDDKKKYQGRVTELEAKLEELESKDMGEAEKLQRELDREKSRADKAETDLVGLKETHKADQRNLALADIGKNFKFLDTVPPETRKMIIAQEFTDLDDLGNQVLVDDRVKTLSEKYAGLIVADTGSGAGSKAGDGAGATGGGDDKIITKLDGMSDADIVANAGQLLKEAQAAE